MNVFRAYTRIDSLSLQAFAPVFTERAIPSMLKMLTII